MLESQASPVRIPAAAAAEPTVARPALALSLLIGLSAVKLLAHLITTWVTPYEIHRDEFLYLGMGEHLQFWRMDFPPAIAVLAKVARACFGDTLFAVRFFPALAGTALVTMTGLLTRQLGGGRFAQGLAMTALLLCALFLRPAALFQPVVFDQLCWTLALFSLVKLARTPRPRWWLLLGLAGGLGLLTKFSIGFLAIGVVASLTLTPAGRAALRTRWPYLTALVSLALGSASIVGQVRLGFPVALHMHELQHSQLERLSYFDFLSGQALMLGPALLLAIAGVVYLLGAPAMRAYRAAGWACATTFLVLMFLHGKPYYIGPIYPLLFAAGAAALGRLSDRPRCVANAGMLMLVLLWSGLSVPFGLPLLPPPRMARFAHAVGLQAAVTTNRGKVLPLPQDYADMLGWDEQVAVVAKVYQSLTPEQRASTCLLARNYGEAGALDFYGPRHGLPGRILLPNNDLLWPPPPGGCPLAVALGIPTNDLTGYFRTVRLVTTYDNEWRVPEERGVPISIAETPTRGVDDAWPTLKRHRPRPPSP